MNPRKALVLGTVLLVPVLVFLFLKTFGVNKFSLRTYFPASVDSTMVAGKWQYDTTFQKVPDFQLTDHTGKPFSQTDIQGKISVASFFFTSCEGTCKQLSAQLSRVQDAFRLQPDVKILSITSRPEADRQPQLAAYAEKYQARPDKWFFLTGTPLQIQQLADKGFRLNSPESALPDGGPMGIYSDRLMLVDRNRMVRGIYDGADPADVDRLITEVNVLLSLTEQPNEK